jgi:hypothetical protein
MNSPNMTYFANLEGPQLVAELTERVQRYQEWLLETGYFAIGLKSAQFIHNMDPRGYSGFEMRRRGPRGDHTGIKINHYGSLFYQLMSQLAGQRLVFEPQAPGDDWRSGDRARRARGVSDHLLRAGMEATLRKAEDIAVTMGMAWTAADWDALAGHPTLPSLDGDEVELTGDVKRRAYMPGDVAVDMEARDGADPEEVSWAILRRWVNVHDLAARLPEFATKILGAVGGREGKDLETDLRRSLFSWDSARVRHRVALYEFRHDSTDACKLGRRVLFIPGIPEPLMASELPFVDEEGNRRMCVRRLALADIPGTPLGFSPLWFMLAPQEARDVVASIEITNLKTHGVGVVTAPIGANMSSKALGGGGLSFIEHTPGMEPKLQNFTAQPPDIAGVQQRYDDTMQKLIAVSPVSRGDPPASLKSGSALLFVQATTAQSMQRFQGRITSHHEGHAEDELFLFGTFAPAMPIKVPGPASERMEEVAGEDVRGISRVKMEVGNPLTRTLAGRVQIASDLLAQGLIKDPAQYVRIMDGEDVEKLYERERRQRVLVDEENAMLRQGRKPIVSPTDDPMLHIQGHAQELDSQQARMNPTLRGVTIAHIEEHRNGWMQLTLANPGMLEALGYPLMQSALGMAGVPPGEDPEGGGTSGAQAAPALGAPPEDAQMPEPPRLPAGASAMTGVNPTAPGPGGAQ